MNSTENRLEQEYRKNLERCSKIIEDAEKRHDLDTMVSALKEFQVWREKLTELHDAEIQEMERKMVSGI